MRDAIAWSYDLLTPEEQAVFRCFATFIGGCTLEAAEAVCSVPNGADGAAAPDSDLIAVIESLASQSLLRTDPSLTDDAAPRLSMLEMVREFASEQLAASSDDAPGRRHAEYYLGLATQALRTYWGDEPGDVRGLIQSEIGNLRAAVGWSIAHGDAEMAMRLAIAMFDPQSHTGDNAREQQMWLHRALALPGRSPNARVSALIRYAVATGIDDLAGAIGLAEEAQTLAMAHDDAFGIAESQRIIGVLEINTGNTDRARRCLFDALTRFRSLGVRGRVGWTLIQLSVLDGIGDEGDLVHAAGYCEEALAIFRDLDHVRGIETALNWHAEIALKLGDLPKSLASAHEGLAIPRRDPWSSDYLDRVADIAGRAGQAKTAARLYGAADELRERAGRRIEPAFRAEHERRVEVARRALVEADFEAAWAVGRSLAPEEAVAEALAVVIKPTDPPPFSLSPREAEVLRMLADGLSDRDIAAALFIGERTVNTHVARIYTKLGVHNRAGAVAAAGLVAPPSVGTGPA